MYGVVHRDMHKIFFRTFELLSNNQFYIQQYLERVQVY